MLDRTKIYEEQKLRYADRDLDNPYTLNGFRGTFAFSDHNLVPEEIRNLALLTLGKERFRDIPLAKVEEIARAVHGEDRQPGFMVRLYERMTELERRVQQGLKPTTAEHEPEFTLEDWNNDTLNNTQADSA